MAKLGRDEIIQSQPIQLLSLILRPTAATYMDYGPVTAHLKHIFTIHVKKYRLVPTKLEVGTYSLQIENKAQIKPNAAKAQIGLGQAEAMRIIQVLVVLVGQDK